MDRQDKINYLEMTMKHHIPNRAYANTDQYAMEWGHDTWNGLLKNSNDNMINEVYETCVKDNEVNGVVFTI